MKLILVPCDFSQPSIEALKFAAEIAPRQEAEIRLLTSIELPVLPKSSVTNAYQSDYMRELRLAAELKLNQAADRWVKDAAKTTSEVEFGSLLEAIERSIEVHGAGVVVMGTHGASGLKEFTIGSNTEKIVRHINIPLIAVKKSVNKVSNIIFPVRPDEDIQAVVLRVKKLQEIFKANLHVVYVNTPSSFRRDSDVKPKLEAFGKKYQLYNYTLNIRSDYSEAEGIINFTSEFKDPMVAMRTHGRKGITHLLKASVTEDVVNHIECPVWTLKVK